MASSHPPQERPESIIVGLGASAGGLQAIQEFFDNLPSDTGAAFVIVQHLSPDFDSLMEEILGRHTEMRIVRVSDRERIRKNHVYLIPPRVDLRVEGAELRVAPQSQDKVVQHPINGFFHSMAEVCQQSAIAIVLSGTGTDGALGVRAVKEAGGVVLVQDPEESGFDGMPRAALATGAVDLVLSAEDLASKTVEVLAHPLLHEEVLEAPVGDDEGPEFVSILETLESTTGLSLRAYKPGTILRRIQRRMAVVQLDSMQAYLERLKSDAPECKALADDCLIHVTRFFRDPKAFDMLQKRLTASMVAQSALDRPFRVWVVGCSTGEEAYSIAITLERIALETGVRSDYKIFATDLDPTAIEMASNGRFSVGACADLNEEELSRYFVRGDEMLTVKPMIRSKLAFAKHNVLTDPPFPKADLVTCRNLLIYLRPAAQRIALERLHFSLNIGGTLFLGPSEALDPLASDYRVVDQNWRIFEKTVERRTAAISETHFRPGGGAVSASARRSASRDIEHVERLKLACERLVSTMATCGVLFESDGELVYTFGDIAKFLEVPRGRVETSVYAMIPREQSARLRAGMREAAARDEAVRVEHVRAGANDEPHSVDVVAIDVPEGQRPLYAMVVRGTGEGAMVPDVLEKGELDELSRVHVEALERELQTTQQSLQTTIEELETTNEEMQKINEELLSSNEELQSTNEELHSVNEELYTVNAEHQSKIAELAEVTESLESLLQATRIGMLFVDEELRVQRFTPDAQLGLPLREYDVGRSLKELATTLDIDLAEIAERVMRDHRPWEQRLVTSEGVPVLAAARAYGNSHTDSEGCVITLVDLTAQGGVVHGVGSVSELVEVLPSLETAVIWVRCATTGKFRYVSPEFERVWGLDVSRCLEDPATWRSAVHPDDRNRVEAFLMNPAEDGAAASEYRILSPQGTEVWFEDRVCGEMQSESGEALISGIAIDQTQRVRKEAESRSHGELITSAANELDHNVVLLHPSGEIQWANKSARRALCGEQALPRTLESRVESKRNRAELRAAMTSIRTMDEERAEVTVELIPETDQVPEVVGLVLSRLARRDGKETILCQWLDRVDERKSARELAESNQRLELQAHTDALTGLLNRRGLDKALRDDLTLCSRSGGTVVVLLIDCDNFKQINDTYSHTTGDWVLEELGARLRGALRPTDALGRIGGDEFLVVLPDTRIAEGAHVGEKLRQAVADRPFAQDGQTLCVTISIGVACVKSGSYQIEDLVQHADELLRSSKTAGRNQVTFVSDGTHGQVEKGRDVIDELLAPGGLTIARQSINVVSTGEAIGYELFARSTQTPHEPVDFFGMARAQGRLDDLDLRSLEVAVEKIKSLGSALRFHVNLFPSTLLLADRARVDAILSGIPNPERVCLELSEQQFVGPSAELRERLGQLRQKGFRIALDDVGYGRSALESLLAIEPEVTKIDCSMLRAVDGEHPAPRRALERLVRMLESLDTEVIAEGVERESQRELLVELGVEVAQGHLWSAPNAVEVPG